MYNIPLRACASPDDHIVSSSSHSRGFFPGSLGIVHSLDGTWRGLLDGSGDDIGDVKIHDTGNEGMNLNGSNSTVVRFRAADFD